MHYRCNDSETTATVDTPSVCNCACSICMSGSCCQVPDPNRPAPRTYTTTSTFTFPGVTWECGVIDHDYAPFDPSRIYCRKCGKFKAAP